jgi:hypothetical protein
MIRPWSDAMPNTIERVKADWYSRTLWCNGVMLPFTCQLTRNLLQTLYKEVLDLRKQLATINSFGIVSWQHYWCRSPSAGWWFDSICSLYLSQKRCKWNGFGARRAAGRFTIIANNQHRLSHSRKGGRARWSDGLWAWGLNASELTPVAHLSIPSRNYWPII